MQRPQRFRWFSGLAIPTLLACALACQAPTPEEQALHERGKAFAGFLARLRDLPDDPARARLTDFLEPTADRDAEVEEYLAQFRSSSGKLRVTAAAVQEVELAADGEGYVTFLVVAEAPNGQEIAATQRTHWRRVDGRWYRTDREPEKKLVRR